MTSARSKAEKPDTDNMEEKIRRLGEGKQHVLEVPHVEYHAICHSVPRYLSLR